MDGIQPYAAPRPRRSAPAGPHYQVHAHPAAPARRPTRGREGPVGLRPGRRRRVWLVLMVAVPLGVASSVYAVRQPAVYRADDANPDQAPAVRPVLECSSRTRRPPATPIRPRITCPTASPCSRARGWPSRSSTTRRSSWGATAAGGRRRRRTGQQSPDQDRAQHQLGHRLARRHRPRPDHPQLSTLLDVFFQRDRRPRSTTRIKTSAISPN